MPFLTRPHVEQLAGGEWSLTEPLVYAGRSEQWMVPTGFVTDFASVPVPVRWLIPADGPWTAAAVVHDWFCEVGIAAGQVSSRDADGVFRRMCRELGTPVLRRWLMWAGVRWGAVASPVRRPGLARDLPAVLAISVLAVPLVVPVSLVVGIGLAVDAVVDRALTLALRLTGHPADPPGSWLDERVVPPQSKPDSR
ncbi:Protein of unknown function [Klenkia marina]|uniref:DUF1353 domain-containing protein n=1 Tax=Klenkia marina TaxID=1960309 RepID=A0A1G4X8R8_9ACTN|nr:DUF1353 domain-containing protein [Klenkia marina]SCX37581.1 Protein of unknown function [Klenkia marina]